MRELLEKWAALDPEWCRVDDERASVMTDVGTFLERPRFSAQYHRLGLYEADILAAVIEAIEARGYVPWHLGRDEDGFAADVTRYPHGYPVTVYGPDKSRTAAEALLAAYLAALARVRGDT